LLEQFLPSVVAHSPEATVYLADNGSVDESIAVVQKRFPSVKIIKNHGNFGYAKGYNTALKSVREDLYVLLNSDVEVTPGWLAPVISLFDADGQLAIAQPKILDYKNKAYFEYAGAAGGFIDKYGFPYCRGRIFETLEKDKGQYDDIADIFWASGACFFIRRDAFWELGGFDESYFAHQEEIDLCWRAFNMGLKAKYCGTSSVYHVGGATLGHQSARKTYLNFRNSLLMMVKNVPDSLFATMFIRLTLDGVAGIRYLLQGKPEHLWAVLKSHVYFYRYLFPTLARRGPKGGKYYRIRSVVKSYYIDGKRFYRDLF
jgi:GT2 family glycosyltransferase